MLCVLLYEAFFLELTLRFGELFFLSSVPSHSQELTQDVICLLFSQRLKKCVHHGSLCVLSSTKCPCTSYLCSTIGCCRIDLLYPFVRGCFAAHIHMTCVFGHQSKGRSQRESRVSWKSVVLWLLDRLYSKSCDLSTRLLLSKWNVCWHLESFTGLTGPVGQRVLNHQDGSWFTASSTDRNLFSSSGALVSSRG